ncbi:MAG: hypothetical protein AAFO82_05135, partial [Bacteroidota bacterium]
MRTSGVVEKVFSNNFHLLPFIIYQNRNDKMDKNNITNWLERLQQESWHLELLVSGFSILLLVQAGQQLIDFQE